jgi:hypothetical protein
MSELILIRKRLSELVKRKKQLLTSKDKDIIQLLSQCQDHNISLVKASVAVLQEAIHLKWIDTVSLIPDVKSTLITTK